MLTSATDHYERQQQITAAGLTAARRKKWTDSLGVAQTVALFQAGAAQDALDSIGPMLDEQGISAPLRGDISARSFGGTASSGLGLDSLFQMASSPEALALMVVTQIQDAARQAAGVSIVGRPGIGYVRMLNTPSCSRCAVLAGKFFRFNAGFDRHPRCDCRHIPSNEDTSGDLRTDPSAYFESLSESEQARIFGKANSEAIRQGADIGQIVNAYGRSAGMQVAGVSPIKVIKGRKYTTAGTTKRAQAAQQQKGLRRNGPQQIRLMPESIFARAASREEAQRLLRLYGWILDEPAIARGRAAFAAQRRVDRAARARARRAALRTG